MLADLNPVLRFARVVYLPGTRPVESVGYDHRLFTCLTGAVSITLPQETVELLPGTVVYIPSYTPYCIRVHGEADATLVIFDFDLTSEHGEKLDSMGTLQKAQWDGSRPHTETVPEEFAVPIVIRDGVECVSDMQRIARLFVEQSPCWREFSSGMTKLILLRMLTQTRERQVPALARNLMAFVAEHYSKPLLNGEIARAFHYHPYHLSRVMRETTGMTLKAYILDYRIRVAKSLLVSTGDSITDIALQCGFSGSAYFSKVFLKTVGVTPSAYRKQTRI